ncbi:MAG: hypothetical protein MUQ10_03275, partial [Anaerolineae bacterium]|nr:hypothetical protein [Anaerolineae bacterium]
MRISDKRVHKRPGHLSSALLWAGAFLLTLAAGAIIDDLRWREIAETLRSTATRLIRPIPDSASLPLLIIDMGGRSYSEILIQREGALSTGVFIPSGQDFVTATIRLQDGANPAP